MKFNNLHWALALTVLTAAVAIGIIAGDWLLAKSEEAAAKLPA